MKKRLKMLLAGFMAMVLLCSCGGQPSGDEGQSKDSSAESSAAQSSGEEETGTENAGMKNTKLDAAYNVNVTTLSPFVNENCYPVLDMIYMMLFVRSSFGGELQGGIGSSYEKKDDFTYVVQIRENITDSAGNPVTAEDVAWSYNYCKENGNISKASYVESCEVTGENEVTMVLNSDALDIFADVVTSVWICSQAAYEASSDGMVADAVGNTGYKVVSFVPGSELVLEREENWWGDAYDDIADQYARNVGTIRLYFVLEASQMQTALEDGTIQMAFATSDFVTTEFDGVAGFKVHSTNANTALSLLFNCTEASICSDINIRQAIAYAVDSQALVNSVCYGKGIVLKSLGHDMFAGYNKAWNEEDYYDFNVDKAEELLEAAGYNGEEIRLMATNNANQKRAAESIQAACMEAGINIKIDLYEPATVTANKNAADNAYDIWFCSVPSSNYMASLYRYYLDAEQYGGASCNGIVDEELQNMMELVCNEETMNEENINAIHQYVKEQCYEIGLYSMQRHCVTTDQVESVFYDGHCMVAYNATVLSDDWALTAD